MPESVHIIDPKPEERTRLAAALAGEPVSVSAYDSVEQFLAQLGVSSSGCVLAPADLAGPGVRALIEEIRHRDLPLAVVVIARNADLATVVELMRAGAADCLEYPVAEPRLRSVVREVIGADC